MADEDDEDVAREACDVFFLLNFIRSGHAAVRFRKTLDLHGCQELRRVLERSSTLQRLELRARFRGIGDRGALALARGLQLSQNLTSIALSGQDVGPGGVESICQALRPPRQIRTLSLEVNTIGDEGARHIAELLTTTTTLELLDLQGNQISEAGAILLSTGLAANRSLISLRLQDNPIDDNGAEAIGGALKRNHTLEALDLRSCSIGDGARVLANALAEARPAVVLETLLMDDNQMKRPGGLAFARAVALNKSLLRLGLAHCGIPVNTLAAVNRGLKENARLVHARFAMAAHSIEPRPFQFCSVLLAGQHQAGKSSLLKALLKGNKHGNGKGNGEHEIHAVLSGAGELKPVNGDISSYVTGFAHRVMAQAFSKHVPKVTDTSIGAVVEQDAAPIALTSKYTYSKAQLREAKDSEAVRILAWDGGNDPIMHSFLFKQAGLTIVAVDLSSSLPSVSATLRAWLASAALYTTLADVMVVACKLDKVKESQQRKRIQAVDKVIRRAVSDFEETVVSNEASGLCVFPVSNIDRTGLKGAMEAFAGVVRSNPIVYTQICPLWLQCLDALKSHGSREPAMLFSQVEALLKQKVTGIVLKGDEIQNMLKLFHEMGFIIFYTTTFSLRSTIVLQREWVAQAVDLIINPGREHSVQEKQGFKKAGLEEDSIWLTTDGVLTEDLLAFFLGTDHLDFFLDLLQYTMVISPWNQVESGRRFRVPSMLMPEEDGQAKAKTNGMIAQLKFKSLPPGVFERLVCLLVSTKSGESGGASTLCRDIARIKLSQENEVIAKCVQGQDVIEAEFMQQQTAGQTLRMLDALLRRINDGFTDGRLSWTIFVKDGLEFRPLQCDILKHRKSGPWSTAKRKRKDVNYERFLQL